MNKELINLIISITLILTIGLITGYTVGYFRATQNNFPEIKMVDEINPGITTIKLLEVKNGKLYGKISGQSARLAFSGDNIIELEKESEFEIPLNEIQLKNFYQAGNIPENALFVASKKGKYYYSVFEKRAYNIKAENRIFFNSDQEAEKMGYIKRQSF